MSESGLTNSVPVNTKASAITDFGAVKMPAVKDATTVDSSGLSKVINAHQIEFLSNIKPFVDKDFKTVFAGAVKEVAGLATITDTAVFKDNLEAAQLGWIQRRIIVLYYRFLAMENMSRQYSTTTSKAIQTKFEGVYYKYEFYKAKFGVDTPMELAQEAGKVLEVGEASRSHYSMIRDIDSNYDPIGAKALGN